jgi:hypothetical protein
MSGGGPLLRHGGDDLVSDYRVVLIATRSPTRETLAWKPVRLSHDADGGRSVWRMRVSRIGYVGMRTDDVEPGPRSDPMTRRGPTVHDASEVIPRSHADP